MYPDEWKYKFIPEVKMKVFRQQQQQTNTFRICNMKHYWIVIELMLILKNG